MRSPPSAFTTGTAKGSVITMIDTESRIVPSSDHEHDEGGHEAVEAELGARGERAHLLGQVRHGQHLPEDARTEDAGTGSRP